MDRFDDMPRRHPLSSQVTDREIECGEFDDFGCSYSEDARRLLQFPVEIGERLKHYAVADGTVVICDNAFEGCDAFRSVELPDTLKVIGELAFDGCERLEEISLPDGLLAIGKNAFTNCERLEKITIPASVKIIGGNPFYRTRIRSVESLSESFVTINDCLIDLSDGTLIAYFGSATDFTLPAEVKIVGEDAFHEVSTLRSITIPEGVKAINRFAFVGCAALAEMRFPGSLEHVDESAISFCRKLSATHIASTTSAEVKSQIKTAVSQRDNRGGC